MEAPQSLPPKESNEKNISFQYQDLIFEDAFKIDNKTYLRFLVPQAEPFFVQMTKSEYMDYISTYFDQYDDLLSLFEGDETSIVVDKCFPRFEEIEELETQVLKLNEKKEPEVQEGFIVVYHIWGLVEGLTTKIEIIQE